MTNFNASSFRFFERKVAQGIALSDFSGSLLYHTKNYQGTTTSCAGSTRAFGLYHTKNYQGTTTHRQAGTTGDRIIPYQELPGNYNIAALAFSISFYYTIPRTTRELQHDNDAPADKFNYTIPRTTRELQRRRQKLCGAGDYTIPRTTRELQLSPQIGKMVIHYTIPRTTRELQRKSYNCFRTRNYTIPRTTRELQRVCPPCRCRDYYTIPRTTRELQPLTDRGFPALHYTIPRTTRELHPKACCFTGAHHRKSEEVYNRTSTSGESFFTLPQPAISVARYTEQGPHNQ